jgi:hypothetical protein
MLLTTGSREARHCADNAEVGGAVPSRWIAYKQTALWSSINHPDRGIEQKRTG